MSLAAAPRRLRATPHEIAGAHVLIPLTHPVHRRMVVGSGLVDLMAAHGLHVMCEESPPAGSPFRRWLRGGPMRTASYVSREGEGQSYRYKLARRLAKRQRLEIGCLRALRAVTDPEWLAARLEARLPIDAHAARLIDSTDPDVVLVPTFLHSGDETEIIKAASAQDIPVVALVSSWDTLTCKGGFLVRPDRLMVWGQESREHAMTLHGFRAKQIDVVGPPHFDAYAVPLPAADAPRPYIFFAGTSLSYMPEETALVRYLAAEVHRLSPSLTVWYRPHPRNAGQSFTDLLDTPGLALDSATAKGFDDDAVRLRQTLDQSRCLVSFFSTLVIEAALRRVPSAIVAFGQATGGAESGYVDRPVGALADQTRFDHMREVLRWPGILTSKNPMDLVKDVLDQSRWRGSPILDDLQIAAQRVARCDGQAQQRIVAALGEVLAHGH